MAIVALDERPFVEPANMHRAAAGQAPNLVLEKVEDGEEFRVRANVRERGNDFLGAAENREPVMDYGDRRIGLGAARPPQRQALQHRSPSRCKSRTSTETTSFLMSFASRSR